MNKLVLMLLIDAFRADYIRYTTYLKRKQESGITGKFRECFGFVPRAAYFAGLSAEQFGFTNMFCYDPNHSPFTAARFFPAVNDYPKIERVTGVRQAIEQLARTRTTSYVAKYLYSGEIPIQYLPRFDFSEKYAIWDAKYPDQTFFHILNEHQIPWYVCAWPETNLLDDHCDQVIIDKTLQEISLKHKFAFLHLQELDSIGHFYGPSSKEIIQAVQKTDQLIQALVQDLERRFDQVNLLIFGDHGMVNIHSLLDVWERIHQTGLCEGNDFTFFLDSTMARFWFYTKAAQRKVTEALSDVKGGHLLSQEELEYFGIAHCDPRNGELYFLADPGVLIYPNFFQRTEPPIKGMHGYDPNFVDNLGYFLLTNGEGTEFSSCGYVDPPQIFNTLLKLMDLPEKPNYPPSVFSQTEKVNLPAYTCHQHSEANSIVEQQLGTICQEVCQVVGEPEAIVLTGSFGRGEGGMILENDKLLPVNDYDLIVVSATNKQTELNELGEKLAHQLGTDYVDLAWSDGNWGYLPLTMLNYDLKYGSQVIQGRGDVLDRMPHYPAADLPVIEAVTLLLNRTAGLLTGLRGEFFMGRQLSPQEKRYLSNQAIKASIAVGDWFLIYWKSYDVSYQTRKERFSAFGKAHGLSMEMLQRVVNAYHLKIYPSRADDFSIPDLGGVWEDLKMAIIQSCAVLSASTITTLDDAMSAYLEEMYAQKCYQEDNLCCLQNKVLSAVVKPSAAKRLSFRSALYSGLPFLLAAALEEQDRNQNFQTALRLVREGYFLPTDTEWSFNNWENVRSKIIQWWFALIH
uniref:Alkaline phosphatase family protein n=1 Tax=candidate division WOR-3 bacterium TaxID=2052148 RepID=A0A7V3KNC2_UNCW3